MRIGIPKIKFVRQNKYKFEINNAFWILISQSFIMYFFLKKNKGVEQILRKRISFYLLIYFV